MSCGCGVGVAPVETKCAKVDGNRWAVEAVRGLARGAVEPQHWNKLLIGVRSRRVDLFDRYHAAVFAIRSAANDKCES